MARGDIIQMNISHLRCGPVGVRFTRPPRLSPSQADDGGQVESRFAGRHKCASGA
jgi:hypothetical protein